MNNKSVRRQHAIYYRSQRTELGMNPIEELGGFQMNMFLDDVGLRIMPIGGQARKRPFEVTLEPSNPKVERMIMAGLARHGFNDSLESTLSEFFHLLAPEVCAEDRAVYDIAYEEEPTSKKLVGFELFFVPEHQITARRGKLFQSVPPDIAEKRNVPRTIPLPREDLIIFEPPRGFKQPLQRMRTNLSRLGGFQFASLVQQAQTSKLPYDFKAHQSSQDLALAEACREIGWTGRGQLYGKVLSYYWIQKDLVFWKFLTSLREGFLLSLNEALRRIGQKLEFEAQLAISGLPTQEEIASALEALRSGACAFTHVMDPLGY